MYSPNTSRFWPVSEAPDGSTHRSSSDWPGNGSTLSGAPSPTSSSSVGSTSTSETGADTRPGGKRVGLCTISGMRVEFSKKFILYQRPRSPSMSPWSASSTTTVSSATPRPARVEVSRAVHSSR